MKKFEEGVFSDLRNLKPGVDASLEEPKVCSFLFFFLLFSPCILAIGRGAEREGNVSSFPLTLYKPTSLPSNRNYVCRVDHFISQLRILFYYVSFVLGITAALPPLAFFPCCQNVITDRSFFFFKKKESFPGSLVQISMYSNTEETKSVLLVCIHFIFFLIRLVIYFPFIYI